MHTQEVFQKVKEILRSSESVAWLLIDPDCHLRVRIDPVKRSVKYFYRLRYPRQICRYIGSFDNMSPAEARRIAFDMAAKVDAGLSLPTSRTLTNFEHAGLQAQDSQGITLSALLIYWRDAEMRKDPPRWDPSDRKAALKVEGIVRNHVEPAFGQRPFTNITAEELEEFLSTLFRKHSSFATSLRCWIKSAFMYAERQHLCNDGYSKMTMLDLLLKDARWRRRGPQAHQPSLPYEHVPEFMAELREIGGTTARCLEVAILTCSRVGTVTQMRWEDIDFEQKIWTCPQQTMKIKNNGDHIVYLSDEVLRIISSMPRVLPRGRKAIWVFSTARGDRICNALTKPIASINERRKARGLPVWIDPEQTRLSGKPTPPTVHGFRASFKTWSRSERLGNWRRYNDDAVERCLHHYVADKYGGAYDRESFPSMQRQILVDWAHFCYSYVPEL